MIDSQANSPRFRHEQPLNASTAHPNAATAAAEAFHRRSSSTASLSAAAAAAALRARPTTPINVAKVQTKRTLRRSESQSSSAGRSTPDTRDRPGHLRRQSSSGSMTERSFRSPSPGAPHQRSLSSGGIPRNSYHSHEPPPPVPAIPASVNMEAAKRQGGRPKSLGIVSTPVRTASQKSKDKAGPFFGAAKQGDVSNFRTSDAIMSSPTPPTQRTHVQDDSERPESGASSVNFSYPARVRLSSPAPSSPSFNRPEEASYAPTPTPQTSQRKRSATTSPKRGGSIRGARSSSVAPVDTSLVYDANSRRMVPRAELALEYQIHAVSEARPKKKKQFSARAGSHLAKGTVGRSHGTAVDHGAFNDAQLAAAESMRSHRAERQPVTPEPQERYQPSILEDPETETEPYPVQHAETSPSPPASNAPEPLPAPRSPTSPQRRPSVVREETDSEAELEEPAPVATPPNTYHALDSVPVRQNIYAHSAPSPPWGDRIAENLPIESRNAPVELAASPMQPSPEAPRSSVYGDNLAVLEPIDTQTLQRGSRGNSVSPARTARFGTVHDNLTVRHEPPPRSISPRKSALKQQSPSRGASPTNMSEVSDTGSAAPDSVTPARKKSVRVSFDDSNTVVVGEAVGKAETDSPVSSSPQAAARRPWYSKVKLGKKKDTNQLDDDEVMKPRPELPIFGSIRGRKPPAPATEERPLVPIAGQSSDHALGELLQEQGPRNEANISKFREPLPPVVTSIEGNGYDSDGDSLDSEAALMADTPRLVSEDSRASETSTLIAELSMPPNGSADVQAANGRGAVDIKDFARESSTTAHDDLQVGEVPTIAVIQPSPRPSEMKSEQSSYIHFPGGFPDTETETDIDDANPQTYRPPSTDESATTRRVTFEPVVQKEDATHTTQTPSTVLATQLAISEPTDESDAGSVYSDAHEDLPEVEGDGFQSLDAIVDSPLASTPPKSVFERAQRPGSVTPTPTVKASERAAVTLATEQHTGKPVDDWEAAKAYWRSLTADRKAQLEVEAAEEAAEEAGAEGDLEEVKPDLKPRRKKSVEKRNAEKKAIEQRRVAADSQQTYMIKPGTQVDQHQPLLKGTLRARSVPAQDAAGSHLRKTMRGTESRPAETGTGMRKSLRSESLEPSKLRRRPVSYQPSLGTTTEVAGANRHARSMSEGLDTPSIRQPRLRRRGSDESTSSFKRARATSQGIGFRKTLRADTNSMDEPRNQQSSRFSVRSISPPASMSGRMRTTLRGDMGNQRRNSQDSGKSYLRFPGPFGGHKAKGNKKSSRFGDDSSGDDGDDVPHRFASRFEDSSDEDVAPQPLPQMTIAKTMRGSKAPRNAPSPPLPEEEELSDGDDEESPQPVAPSSGGFLPRAQTEPSVQDGRPTPRRGFMSAVLRRNKKRGGGIKRRGTVESAARRDTNLERSTEELNAIRANNGYPRLQKRTAPLPARGSNWPLPNDEAEATSDDDDDEQAAVGDGGLVDDEKMIDADGGVKPDFVGEKKKKKKFGALRRMFKLDD